jgi:hypothetical protein
MAVQLTKEFWMNLIIVLVTLTALGLSIWALVAPCKSKFGDSMLRELSDCKTVLYGDCELDYQILSPNISATTSYCCKNKIKPSWNYQLNSCKILINGEKCNDSSYLFKDINDKNMYCCSSIQDAHTSS